MSRADLCYSEPQESRIGSDSRYLFSKPTRPRLRRKHVEASDEATSRRKRADSEELDKLVRAVADGDFNAFEHVFSALHYRVYSAALLLIRDPAQAEEITQDVFTEIWQHADRYDPAKSSAAAWALMITRGRAIDRVRSVTAGARRERETATADVPWDQASETSDDESDREQLREGLGELTDAQREVIMLAFYAGYTHAEIAARLDIPAGTVKSRIRSALTRLRDWMQQPDQAAALKVKG
jgi:RNA polymerase sigma-70 factor (ECF subfamily)